MSTRLLPALSSIFLLLFGSSACRQCEEVPCEQYETLNLYLSGNIPAGTDTLRIYRYENNGLFINKIDSAISLAITGDTLFYPDIDLQFSDLPAFNKDYDLEVVNPVDGLILRISNIQRTYLTHKVCSGWLGSKKAISGCAHLLNGFSFSVSPGTVTTNGNAIFIHY